ncbi:putative reverse transcriptase domain-containing protein [Tanacetum coccineum]
MTTRSACQSTATPQGGRTGGQTSRGSGRNRGRTGDQGNSRINGQGNHRNQNGGAVNDNIQGDVRNVNVNNDRRGCTYKEFLACNLKECRDNKKVKYTAGSFVGKALTWWNSQIYTRSREATVGMSWEDFKNLTREEFCLVNEIQKLEIEFWNHAMVEVGHAAYTDRFHELARLVPHLVTPENKRIKRYIYGLAPQIRDMVTATEPTTIQKAMQKASTPTYESIRNGSLKKNTKKRGNDGEPSRDRNVKDDNKRTRTGNAFATTANLVRREYTGMTPKCTNYTLHHLPESPCQACFSSNRLGHLAKDYRVVPRMVNPVNARNPTAARRACFKCGGTDHFKASFPMLNQAQRPRGGRLNQVMAIDGGQGHGNNGNQARIESSDLGFSYEIEIASGQLVEIDKVIRGCELEIEGHTFNIDLIPFGSRSFDTLRVVGERPEEKVRHLRSAKAKEQKKEDIFVVGNFSKVFLDDLSGLPPNQEIDFCINLIPGAIPVAKSPYRLEPYETEELSGQLKELQDKEVQFLRHVINGDGIHVDPNKIEAIAKSLTILTQKSKTFDWGKEQEKAFQSLKDKLCNAPVLAFPDGPEDFMVYCDASALGLGCVLMQRGAIVFALKIWRHYLYGTKRSDRALYYLDQIWVLLKGDVRTLIMDEAHKSKYSVHPGADKMYYDLRDMYQWLGMKKDIVVYQLEIPKWKWERITMDFVSKPPRTNSGHDTIWVIMDRLTKSAHFLPMHEDYKMDRLARLYLNDIIARHGVPILIISDHDSHFTSRKKGKLAPRFVGPFEITERIGPVAYRLRLPEELNSVHDTFHVSNLRKCLADPTLQIPLDEIRVDAKLNFVEEPAEILEREFKKLK